MINSTLQYLYVEVRVPHLFTAAVTYLNGIPGRRVVCVPVCNQLLRRRPSTSPPFALTPATCLRPLKRNLKRNDNVDRCCYCKHSLTCNTDLRARFLSTSPLVDDVPCLLTCSCLAFVLLSFMPTTVEL